LLDRRVQRIGGRAHGIHDGLPRRISGSACFVRCGARSLGSDPGFLAGEARSLGSVPELLALLSNRFERLAMMVALIVPPSHRGTKHLIPTPPAGRMLTSVDRQHDHRCISRAKVHRVREARHHGTTRLSMNARKVKRTGRNAFDDSVQLLAELSPQAETPGLIPLAHFECLVFGLWPEDNVQCHFNLGAWRVPRPMGWPSQDSSGAQPNVDQVPSVPRRTARMHLRARSH